MQNCIEIKHLQKRYKDFALKDVSFSVPCGTVMGFIGENGAGKSTTIKSLLGLVRPDEGEITVFGKPVGELSKRDREDIGVVVDEACFPENLKIRELDKVLGQLYSRWDGAAFDRYARAFSLPTDKEFKDLSKGTKMKLSIAAALSHGSKLLILDEPTSGLDPVVRDEILDVFFEFIQDESHAVLMSSHIVTDLEKICDYITLIHDGAVVFSEAKDSLLGRYGLLRCGRVAFSAVDKSAVVGQRENAYGVEALVERSRLRGDYAVDPAGIEEIMLYFIKGDRQ